MKKMISSLFLPFILLVWISYQCYSTSPKSSLTSTINLLEQDPLLNKIIDGSVDFVYDTPIDQDWAKKKFAVGPIYNEPADSYGYDYDSLSEAKWNKK